VTQVEKTIREEIPERDLKMLISNTGVLYDWPAAYTPNAGPMDSELMVQLTGGHETPSFEYVRRLRRTFKEEYPFLDFYFKTGGLLTSALNFGLPSPINIQIEGNELEKSHEIAREIKNTVETVEGTVDVRIKQKLDYPQLELDIDRTKAAMLGLDVEETVKNVVTSLNSSVNFDPAFWIDEANGNHYFVGAQYREADINSIDTLLDIPITGAETEKTNRAMDRLFRPAPRGAHDGRTRDNEVVRLRNIADIKRGTAPTEVNHVNISRVIDVFANVEGRDIGSVAAEIERKIGGREWPEGYSVHIRGEVQSMRESFGGLAFGFALAVVLIYFVMVTLFKSFLDPLIVMLAVPLGLVGVLWILFGTGTTLNVQSFMGTIFMIGIAQSNSTLLVEFANRLREQGRSAREAVIEAAQIRLRPIIITAAAAILALLPLALNPGEPSMPLARAVIGGLASSTVLILVVVPILYLRFKR